MRMASTFMSKQIDKRPAQRELHISALSPAGSAAKSSPKVWTPPPELSDVLGSRRHQGSVAGMHFLSQPRAWFLHPECCSDAFDVLPDPCNHPS